MPAGSRSGRSLVDVPNYSPEESLEATAYSPSSSGFPWFATARLACQLGVYFNFALGLDGISVDLGSFYRLSDMLSNGSRS
jgi:hypothetical protein